MLLALVGWEACVGGGQDLFGPSGHGAGGPVGGQGGSAGAGGTTITSSTSSTSSTTTTTTGTTTTSTTSTTSTTTTSSSTACYPPNHECGLYCVGNTAATGCFLSQSCLPCPSVDHATMGCSAFGQCVFSCVSPYTKSGNGCVCPTECCGAQDCQSPATCSNGQCVSTCDPTTCLFNCMLSGHTQGICGANGDCICS